MTATVEEYSDILYEVKDAVARVTINRPEKLNALSYELVEQLHEALDALAADNTCRVVVLTGAGRGFCSGLDLGAPNPAEAGGGVPYLKSMAAPYSHLGVQYFPLGGINASNMAGYLALPNVVAVGGSWIVKKELVAAKDWDGIAAAAAAAVDALP